MDTASRCDVIVVGAGISGLSAAYRMHEGGLRVRLLDVADEVGGVMQTERRDAFLLEKGPFNIIVKDAEFNKLLRDVAEYVKVVTPDDPHQPRYIWRRGRMWEVPTNPMALMGSKLLPFGSRMRLMRGLIRSRPAGEREDSIYDAAARRFGEEVAETLVTAMVSGIFAGDSRKLSLRACFPPVYEIDRDAKSPIGAMFGRMKAAKEKKKTEPPKPKGLISFQGGLGAFANALAKPLGEDVLLGHRVTALRPYDGGWEISAEAPDKRWNRTLTCDRVVLATSKPATEKLIRPLSVEAADILNSISGASMVVLNLAFRRDQVEHPAKGYGFLVPDNESKFPVLGALFANSVFPGHAPGDQHLFRVFIGGSRDPGAVDQSDDELLARALDGLDRSLGVSGEPTLIDIARWRDAIPQNWIGHIEKIERLRGELAKRPGITLVGNYLEGVAINDCARVGVQAARELLATSSAAISRERAPATPLTDDEPAETPSGATSS